jgi:hypothetical protein
MHTLFLFGSSRYFKEVHSVSTKIHAVCIGNYSASLAQREKCKNLTGASQQSVQFLWKWKQIILQTWHHYLKILGLVWRIYLL